MKVPFAVERFPGQTCNTQASDISLRWQETYICDHNNK